MLRSVASRDISVMLLVRDARLIDSQRINVLLMPSTHQHILRINHCQQRNNGTRSVTFIKLIRFINVAWRAAMRINKHCGMSMF